MSFNDFFLVALILLGSFAFIIAKILISWSVVQLIQIIQFLWHIGLLPLYSKKPIIICHYISEIWIDLVFTVRAWSIIDWKMGL